MFLLAASRDLSPPEEVGGRPTIFGGGAVMSGREKGPLPNQVEGMGTCPGSG